MNALKKVVSKHSRRSSTSSDTAEEQPRPSRGSMDAGSPLKPASPRVQDTVPRLPSESLASHNHHHQQEQSSSATTAGRSSLDGAQRDLGRLDLASDAQGLRRSREHEHEHAEGGLGSKLSQAILDHKDTVQDHQTLAPVLHHRIHHHETEIVTRHREVEKHIHHVQHHVQPLIEEVHLDEKHFHQQHPLTEEYEEKVNTPEDKAFFALLNKQKFTETHICEERTVIDNGEKVKQTIHYHVHNVIQPVIYRDRPIPSLCVPASAALSAASPQQVTRHSLAEPSSRAGPAATAGMRHGQAMEQAGTGVAR